jgi:hypothetical protein
MPLTGQRWAKALTVWDVAAGRAEPIPRASGRRLWTQVPVFAGAVDRKRGDFPLWLDGAMLRLPEAAHALAGRLGTMPSLERSAVGRGAQPLLDAGILGPRDLPLRIVPSRPRALDGWRFA